MSRISGGDMKEYTSKDRYPALVEWVTIVPLLFYVAAYQFNVFDPNATEEQKAQAMGLPGWVASLYGILQTLAKEVTMPMVMSPAQRKDTSIGRLIQNGGFKPWAQFILINIVVQSAFRSLTPRLLLYYGAKWYADLLKMIPDCEIVQGNHTQIYNQTYTPWSGEQCPRFPEGCESGWSQFKHPFLAVPVEATLFLLGIFYVKLALFHMTSLDQVFNKGRDWLAVGVESIAALLYQIMFSTIFDGFAALVSCQNGMLDATGVMLMINLIDRGFGVTHGCTGAILHCFFRGKASQDEGNNPVGENKNGYHALGSEGVESDEGSGLGLSNA